MAIFIVFLLAACSGLSQVPTPSLTPPAASETPTILWFPSTNTPTFMPITVLPPTPEALPGIQDLIFMDDFSNPDIWNLAASDRASAQLENNRLTLSLTSGPLTISSLRSEPSLGDFYAEAMVRVNLCRGHDQFGVLFRTASAGNHYRFVISCDGNIRFERVRGGSTEVLQNWIPSSDAPPGAPAEVKIGLWMSGVEIRLLLNDHLQFSVRDPLFRNGTLGFFARADGDTPVIISFYDLKVYALAYVSPTPTQTPTRTPLP